MTASGALNLFILPTKAHSTHHRWYKRKHNTVRALAHHGELNGSRGSITAREEEDFKRHERTIRKAGIITHTHTQPITLLWVCVCSEWSSYIQQPQTQQWVILVVVRIKQALAGIPGRWIVFLWPSASASASETDENPLQIEDDWTKHQESKGLRGTVNQLRTLQQRCLVHHGDQCQISNHLVIRLQGRLKEKRSGKHGVRTEKHINRQYISQVLTCYKHSAKILLGNVSMF